MKCSGRVSQFEWHYGILVMAVLLNKLGVFCIPPRQIPDDSHLRTSTLRNIFRREKRQKCRQFLLGGEHLSSLRRWVNDSQRRSVLRRLLAYNYYRNRSLKYWLTDNTRSFVCANILFHFFTLEVVKTLRSHLNRPVILVSMWCVNSLQLLILLFPAK